MLDWTHDIIGVFMSLLFCFLFVFKVLFIHYRERDRDREGTSRGRGRGRGKPDAPLSWEPKLDPSTWRSWPKPPRQMPKHFRYPGTCFLCFLEEFRWYLYYFFSTIFDFNSKTIWAKHQKSF